MRPGELAPIDICPDDAHKIKVGMGSRTRRGGKTISTFSFFVFFYETLSRPDMGSGRFDRLVCEGSLLALSICPRPSSNLSRAVQEIENRQDEGSNTPTTPLILDIELLPSYSHVRTYAFVGLQPDSRTWVCCPGPSASYCHVSKMMGKKTAPPDRHGCDCPNLTIPAREGTDSFHSRMDCARIWESSLDVD